MQRFLGGTWSRLALATILSLAAQAAMAGFTPYVIRNAADGTPTVINVDTPAPGQIQFLTTLGSQKAGLGSNDINGQTLGSITALTIKREDNYQNPTYPAGSGPRFAPYLNFWITDGLGNYAVAANEPTNPDFQPLFVNGEYDLDFADLSNKVVKFYESASYAWLPNAGVGLTFADIADFVIAAPTLPRAGVGGGAPRELGSLDTYGVNWVFGDSQNNYISADEGYIVSNFRVAAASAVPEPASWLLVTLGLVGLLAARRRRH